MNTGNVSPPDKRDLGYAEQVLVLRHRIWSRLRQHKGFSPASVESVAACLNLIMDVHQLEYLDKLLDQVNGKISVQQFIDTVLRISAETPRLLKNIQLPPSPLTPEAIEKLLAEEDVEQLRHFLRQTLILISEGCTLLTLIKRGDILQRTVNTACQLVQGTIGLALAIGEGTCVDLATCGTSNHVEIPPTLVQDLLPLLDTKGPAHVSRPERLPQLLLDILRYDETQQLISVPLWYRGNPRGYVLVNVPGDVPVHEEDLYMLAALARQASFALENLTLHSRVEELGRMEERQRIAQDLHDTVAQLLFVIGMEAESLLHTIPEDSPLHRRALRIRRITSRASNELRSAIAALRSYPVSGENTLADALQQTAEEWERLSKLDVTLVLPSQWPTLSGRAARAIYRVVREALINVQKHAHATAVVISVTPFPDRLVVTVQDNGVGFPTHIFQLLESDVNFGLRTMEHLAEAVGGYLELSNGEDGGAMVRLVLPLPA